MTKKRKIEPIDLNKVKRYPIKKRPTKTHIKSFGKPIISLSGSNFFESLPNFLKATDLNDFINLIHKARKKNKACL